MVKKFKINCNAKSSVVPVTFYVGDPSDDNHPIHFQVKWLSEKKGVMVPPEILDSFKNLHEIAARNRVSVQDLCSYVIEGLENDDIVNKERKRIGKNLNIIEKREQQKMVSSQMNQAQNSTQNNIKTQNDNKNEG